MTSTTGAIEPEPTPQEPERDDVSTMVDRSWDEIFGMENEEREAFQLKALRRRIEELQPKLKALRSQMEHSGFRRIDRLEDVAPLLFPDSVYKSYPVSLVEKAQFSRLTQWLGGYTTIDLSAAELSNCTGVDSWIDTLDAQTPLRVIHTSGTSGKLSFFPRSTAEIMSYFRSYMKGHEGFGEPGVKLGHYGDLRLPMVSPVPRYGRQMRNRCFPLIEKYVVPSPDQLHTLDFEVSADLVSLSGRIRIAQAKGEVSKIVLSEGQRVAMIKYMADLEKRTADATGFYGKIIEKLQGQRVLAGGYANLLQDVSVAGLARGMRDIFGEGSIGQTSGGTKEGALRPDWMERVMEFTGIKKWARNYGMSEMVTIMPMGDPGWYHIPPYLIPFLLDPATGELLPRTGVVTGRFAFYDLLAQTNWGGIISGDKVTIDWDTPSPSGRRGPRVRADISRYTVEVTGEDKITCAATIDNTDNALKALLNVN
jgi:hypothetical protein